MSHRAEEKTKYTIMKMCYLGAGEMTQKLETQRTQGHEPLNPYCGSQTPVAPALGRSMVLNSVSAVLMCTHSHTELHAYT